MEALEWTFFFVIRSNSTHKMMNFFYWCPSYIFLVLGGTSLPKEMQSKILPLLLYQLSPSSSKLPPQFYCTLFCDLPRDQDTRQKRLIVCGFFVPFILGDWKDAFVSRFKAKWGEGLFPSPLFSGIIPLPSYSILSSIIYHGSCSLPPYSISFIRFI